MVQLLVHFWLEKTAEPFSGFKSSNDYISNIFKEKYHSRLELRQAKPSTHYEELWDDDDPDERMQRMMASVGLG